MLATLLIVAALAGLAAWRLSSALKTLTSEIKNMTPQVQKLQADVAAMRDVNQSAVALLAGLSQQLKDAIAHANNSDDMTALESLSADLESQTAELAAAISQNTPAAPAPAPAPAVDPAPAPPAPTAPTPAA